jgi:hypothetical protein
MTRIANQKVEEVFSNTVAMFEAAGFQVSIGSNSITEYGHSRYMYVNYNNALNWNIGQGAKIRVSDHCTGDRRWLAGDEEFIMVHNAEKHTTEIFHKFNAFFKSEEYAVTELVKSAVQQVTNVAPDKLRADDVITETRVSKKGNNVYTVNRTYTFNIIEKKHIATGYTISKAK